MYEIAQKKILIYGNGTLGLELLERLRESAIEIIGFIDLRAKHLKESAGLKIYAIDELDSLAVKKNEIAIIITVRNIFEHSDIAKALMEKGYENIIYKPLSYLEQTATKNDSLIAKAHSALLEDDALPNFKIPKAETRYHIQFKDEAIIKELEDGQLKVSIPIELLSIGSAAVERWDDRFLISGFAAIDLFRAFNDPSSAERYEAEINRYLRFCAEPGALAKGVKVDKTWERIVIDSRQSIFIEMEKKLESDLGFFYENCISVGTRAAGSFYLTSSGKNRASFLIAKGFKRIPAIISKEDYEAYLGQPQKLIDYLKNNNYPQIFAPIPHPYFYSYRYTASNYTLVCLYSFIKHLTNYIFDNNISRDSLKLLSAMNDNGTLSRQLKILGFDITRLKSEELDGLIDELLGLSLEEEDDKALACDISFISSDMDKELLNKILKATNKLCYALSYNEESALSEICQKHNFKESAKLFATVWNKKLVKGILFEAA